MSRGLLLVVVIACIASCAPPPSLEELRPVSARLGSVNVWSAAAFGGLGVGRAQLTIDDLGGERFVVPVQLTSGTVGAILEVTTWGDEGFDLDLGFTEPGLTGEDLLGTYDGGYGNAAALIGVAGVNLENEHRARFAGTVLSAGVAMFAGHMWLGVETAGEPVILESPPVTDRPVP